ncbi:MAG: YlxR family protein [Clostridia bacterium]|nr:YlxR family protein [Clostridia bacterium]
MQQKKIPMRQCGGCGEMKPKRELVRVVKSPEGEISLDLTSRKNGRGSYICKSIECFEKAIKRKSFERAFGVKIPEETVQNIIKELESE